MNVRRFFLMLLGNQQTTIPGMWAKLTAPPQIAPPLCVCRGEGWSRGEGTATGLETLGLENV